MTRVLVTGSRSWKPIDLATEVLARLREHYGDDLVVVHGAFHGGIDAAFAAGCKALGVRQEPHRQLHRTAGSRVGLGENASMLAAGADLCLVFHRELADSKVAADCVIRALEAGIETWWYSGLTCEPRQIRSWADVMLG